MPDSWLARCQRKVGDAPCPEQVLLKVAVIAWQRFHLAPKAGNVYEAELKMPLSSFYAGGTLRGAIRRTTHRNGRQVSQDAQCLSPPSHTALPLPE